MLGDRVIKSDSPLVSSKIDFADFLGLIVKMLIIKGGQIKRNGYEIIVDGKF